jgi:hypothetical protein
MRPPCKTCAHWDYGAGLSLGICRRYPPLGTGWSRTGERDWCGEHLLAAPPEPEPPKAPEPLFKFL